MKSLIVFLVGIYLVSAQIPFRCESPPSWHARIVREEMVSGRRAFIRGRIAYDKPNERVRIIDEEVSEGSRTDISARYYFHQQGYEIRANFTTKQCEKRPLNDSFHTFAVPDEARYVDTVEIGSNAGQGTGVQVDIWAGETRDGAFESVWTSKGCLPVEESYFNRQYFFAERTTFYNDEGGFNPDDFIPPEFCPPF